VSAARALLVAGALGLLAGCGGSQRPVEPVARGNPFAYDQRAPLQARASTVPTAALPAVLGVSLSPAALQTAASLDVQRVSYRTFDGTRVPGLLAVPRNVPVRGCLIYQGGIGQTKEDSAIIWPGAAAIGLATFAIDARDTGSRGGIARLERDIRSPAGIRRDVVDTVIDWRRGIDYLERQPVCHHNIGYLGSSFGGIVGALLAGSDTRVRAAVLMNLGATWQEALTATQLLLPGFSRQPAALDAALHQLTPLDAAAWVPRIAPRAVMLVNGTQDPYVSPADAAALASAARAPKVVLNYDGNHFPFSGPWASQVGSGIIAFLQRYLVEPASQG